MIKFLNDPNFGAYRKALIIWVGYSSIISMFLISFGINILAISLIILIPFTFLIILSNIFNKDLLKNNYKNLNNIYTDKEDYENIKILFILFSIIICSIVFVNMTLINIIWGLLFVVIIPSIALAIFTYSAVQKIRSLEV